MSQRAALDVIQNLTTATSFRPVKKLEEYFEYLLSVLKDLLHKYNSLKIAEIHNQRQLEQLRDRLKDAADAVYKYADNVCDLYWYASDEEGIEEIKRAIQRDDFAPLTKFIKQLNKLYLEPAQQSCKTAEEKLEEVRASALDLATDCTTKAQEAKSSRHSATRHVRKAILVLGVLLIMFGFTTYTALAMVIFFVSLIFFCFEEWEASVKYTECEREFRELSQKFKDVKTSASSLFGYTRNIKVYLESLSSKINIINQSEETCDVHLRRRLSSAFDRVCHKFRGFRTPIYREKLAAIDKEFQDRLEGIFSGVMK